MKLFNKYKFSDKSQALGGLISTAMGILSLLSFGYGVYLSFKAAGEGGLRVGSLGILSLILAVIGTVIGLISFKEDNKFYGTSRFGSMLCGVIFQDFLLLSRLLLLL